jgi:hypothetical protein
MAFHSDNASAGPRLLRAARRFQHLRRAAIRMVMEKLYASQ